MKRVLLILAEGFEEMEAVIPADLFRRAELDLTIAGLHSKIVKGSRAISIEADILLEDLNDLSFDALVLPGGGPGAKNLAASEKVLSLIESFNSEGRIVAAICASPAVVLAKTSVLQDKKACCYPGCETQADDKSITWGNKKVLTSDNIITSRGPGTAKDFALTIIEKLSGAEKADLVAKAALFPYLR